MSERTSPDGHPSPGQAQGDTSPEPEGKARKSAWLGLVVLALAAMTHGTDATIASIAAPQVGSDLKTSLHELQWVTTGYMVAYAALLIIAGQFGDRFGHRLVFLMGMGGFVLASLVVGLAPNITVLVLFRILQGACGAFMLPSSLALVRLTFPGETRKMAMGIFTGVFAISAALGPVLGGLIVGLAGWRWAFFVNVILGVLLLPGVPAFVRNVRAEQEKQPLDPIGAGLSALVMSTLVLAINRSAIDGWAHPLVWGSLLVFVAAAASFVMRMDRAPHPLIPWPELPSATMIPAWFVILLGSGLMASVWFYIPLFLQNIQHQSALMAGVKMLPIAVAGVIGAVIGGGLNQKTGPRIPMAGGAVLFIVALLGLSRLTPNSSYGAVWPWLALCGLGLNSVLPTAMEVTVGAVKGRLSGIASATGETMGSLGPALGVSASAAGMSHLVLSKINSDRYGLPTDMRAPLSPHADQIAQGSWPQLDGTGQFAATVHQGLAQVFTSSMTSVFLMSALLMVPALIIAVTTMPARHTPEGSHREEDSDSGRVRAEAR